MYISGRHRSVEKHHRVAAYSNHLLKCTAASYAETRVPCRQRSEGWTCGTDWCESLDNLTLNAPSSGVMLRCSLARLDGPTVFSPMYWIVPTKLALSAPSQLTATRQAHLTGPSGNVYSRKE